MSDKPKELIVLDRRPGKILDGAKVELSGILGVKLGSKSESVDQEVAAEVKGFLEAGLITPEEAVVVLRAYLEYQRLVTPVRHKLKEKSEEASRNAQGATRRGIADFSAEEILGVLKKR